MAQRAVEERPLLVIVGEAMAPSTKRLNGLTGSQAPLFLLPVGTANALAKEPEITWQISGAVESIPRRELRRRAQGVAAPYDMPQASGHRVCPGPDAARDQSCSTLNPA